MLVFFASLDSSKKSKFSFTSSRGSRSHRINLRRKASSEKCYKRSSYKSNRRLRDEYRRNRIKRIDGKVIEESEKVRNEEGNKERERRIGISKKEKRLSESDVRAVHKYCTFLGPG
jgi:hypothetical protein